MENSLLNLETIITSIEKLLGFPLSFHLYGEGLRQSVGLKRCRHHHPFCEMIRQQEPRLRSACRRCDLQQVARLNFQFPQGYLKTCHGGVSEWVKPIQVQQACIGVIFIGPFMTKAEVAYQQAVSRSSVSIPQHRHLVREVQREDVGSWSGVVELLCHVLGQASTQAPPSLSRRNIILHKIQNSLTQSITLDDIAKTLHLSSSRTTQVFREEWNCSFPDLLNQQRIAHAEQLMTKTAWSLAQIAEASGFKDVGYFYKVFKKYKNESAARWRKRQTLAEA